MGINGLLPILTKQTARGNLFLCPSIIQSSLVSQSAEEAAEAHASLFAAIMLRPDAVCFAHAWPCLVAQSPTGGIAYSQPVKEKLL